MEAKVGKYKDVRANYSRSPSLQAMNDEGSGKKSPASSMTDASDTEHDLKNNVEDIPVCSESHDYRKFIDHQFPIPVDEVYNMLFSDNKFYRDLLNARLIRSYTEDPWVMQDGDKTREIIYVKAITQAVGPKEVKVVETQVIKKCTKPGVMYSINTSGQNKAVPYADCFTIEMHYCIKALGPSSSLMSIYGYIKFKKSVWGVIKSFLEKSSSEGLLDHCKLLATEIERDIERRTSKQKPTQPQNSSAPVQTKTVAPPTNQPYVMPVAATPAEPPPLETNSPQTLISLWPYCLFLLLLFINVILYWKLYSADTTYKTEYNELNSSKSSLGGSSLEEWSKLLDQDVLRQRGQLGAWRDALDHAVIHLAQTEKALLKVLETIKPSLEAS